MQTEKDQPETLPVKDDDIQFDRENITSTDSQLSNPEQPKAVSPENTILPNEELLNKTAIAPLSEEEKQPKLDEES